MEYIYRKLFAGALNKTALLFFLLMFGLAFSFMIRPVQLTVAKDTGKETIKKDRFQNLLLTKKENNQAGRSKALTFYVKASAFKAKASTTTPYGIVRIDYEYYDNFEEIWALDYRESYTSLPDQNGYSISFESLEDTGWEIDEKADFIFNTNSQLIEVIVSEYDDFSEIWLNDYKLIFEYDEQDRIAKITASEYEGETWTLDMKLTYVHNANGSISYTEEYRSEDWGAEGTLSENEGDVIDEGIDYWDGSIDTYYRETIFNTSLDEYSQMGLDNHNFSFNEYEYAEKDSVDGEYQIQETNLIVEETDTKTVYEMSYWQFDYETESDVFSPVEREIVNYQDGKIANIIYEDTGYEVNGEWNGYARTTYIYDTSTSINRDSELVSGYQLIQNYPNPFNPSTNIQFELPEATEVRLEIFNMIGQPVTTLVNGPLSAGSHKIHFDASQLPSGTYIYSIIAGDFVQSRKMVLLK